MLEAWNQHLFLLLNAPAHPSGLMLASSLAIAQYVIFVVPIYLLLGWLLSDTDETKRHMLRAVLSSALALLLAQGLAYAFPHSRPFVLGLGTNFLEHLPNASFPSDHATLMLAVAFSLMLAVATRVSGVALFVLGVLVAWSRIYLGVHFPLDMVGAFFVGLAGALLVYWVPKTIFDRVYAVVLACYRKLFAPLIRRGWIS